MKKGFTLIELLVALTIVSVIGISVVINFGNIDDDNAKNELVEKYKNLERAAKLFIDLEPQYLDSLTEKYNSNSSNGYAFVAIPVSTLYNEKFIQDVKNPITGENDLINYNVIVFIHSANNKKMIGSCVIDLTNDKNVQIKHPSKCMYGEDKTTESGCKEINGKYKEPFYETCENSLERIID